MYVLRDVFCGIQKWRFENALVKLKMCKSILVVIAKVMKIYNEAQVGMCKRQRYSISRYFYIILVVFQ